MSKQNPLSKEQKEFLDGTTQKELLYNIGNMLYWIQQDLATIKKDIQNGKIKKNTLVQAK